MALPTVDNTVYKNWVVEWRGVGETTWQSGTFGSDTRQASLGELADGSYDVRFQLLGQDARDNSVFSVPFRFVLPVNPGKGFRFRMLILVALVDAFIPG